MKSILLSCFLLASSWLAAQKNGSIEGVLADSNGVGLASVTVVLLQQQDSVMAAYALSDEQGKFLLKRIAPGDYVLQINYLGYQTHYQNLTLTPASPQLKLGNIVLKSGSTLLNAVDITADRSPMTIRKDTIEFNAAAFQTQPGAVVEDLLKRLPSIQVDKNGNIKAQGEQVRNVLVDGKEFFGQDPKMATKNLPADAIDKVQVYDKKSENAEFTGIDDGQDEKTINLKLKEDKKQGYFGTASAGYGTENRFDGKFNVNKFGKKTQFSALGMANNTNQQGFSFDDYINFMGGLGNFMSGGGGRVQISLNPEDIGIPIGFNLENGFTETYAGGLNMNTELGSKTNVSANYFYSNLQNSQERFSNRENILGSSSFASREYQDQFTGNTGHRLNLNIRHKMDSSQNLMFRSSLSINDARFESLGNTEALNEAVLQNKGLRNNFSQGAGISGNARLVYRKRLNKKGRSLVAEASYQNSRTDRDGSLEAENEYNPGTSQSFTESLNQRQAYLDDASNYAATLSYTEPIGRKQYLEWSVAHQQYQNQTFKDFYDRLFTPTPTEVYNPLLSNRFRRGYMYDRAGMKYALNRKKYNLSIGTALQRSELDGKWIESAQVPLNFTFTRLLPSAFLNYDFKQGRNLAVEYNTSFQEPSLEQLQPVVNNSDPLNLYQGNPALKPEYAHQLGFHFLNFDQFTMTSLFANARMSYTQDKITNASYIDSVFRRVLTPINVANDLSINAYVGFNTPIRSIKTNLNVNLNLNYNRGILFVNNQENKTNRWDNALELSFDNRNKKVIDWTIGARIGNNSTAYSVDKTLNQAFLNQNYFSDIAVFPTKKWVLSTGIDFTRYSKENFGEQRDVALWKAGITRFVLKNNKGQLKLSATDLLNQNVGIRRTSQLNFLQEDRIVSLARYFMLSFQYSLSGFNRQDNAFQIKMGPRH